MRVDAMYCEFQQVSTSNYIPFGITVLILVSTDGVTNNFYSIMCLARS